MKVAVFPSKKKKKNMEGTTPKSTVLHMQIKACLAKTSAILLPS